MKQGRELGIHTNCYGNVREGFRKVQPNLVRFDLRIIDRDVSAFREKVADERNCGGFACVARVSFEGKSKNSNVLSELVKKQNQKRELEILC